MKQHDALLEKVLNALDEARSESYDDLLRVREVVLLTDILVEAGVYPVTPVMERQKYTALTMVEGYGARWHIYKGLLECPHCHADLRDLVNGPPFKREIAVYDSEADRTTYLECPDCHKRLT